MCIDGCMGANASTRRAAALAFACLALGACGRKSALLPPASTNAPYEQYARIVQQQSAANHVPAALVGAIIAVESRGNPRAVGASGSMGLMQLKRTTAAQYGITDLFNPAANIAAGTRYLSELLTRFHNSIPLAVAAYRLGPGAVSAAHGIPPAVAGYVERVTSLYHSILRSGLIPAP
jgi:soluble lytic murein transglycosylase-like protein